ncbi:MAG TPA: UDP-4-amino-4,6-dideoxy-N-acetyl-beta-L-altrosamine N-acetyltransferase [Candidatus Methanoperedens sp.]
MLDLKINFEMKKVKLINFINLTDEEKEMIRKWRNNKNIRKLMFSDHIISAEEHSNFIVKLKEDNKNFFWLVKNNEEPIGVISLNRTDFANKNAYLGLYVNPDYKVLGAGQILMGCIKKLAFDKINLHGLRLEVIDGNERAKNFFKKSGFTEEGRLKDFVIKDCRWQDVIVMGILNKNKV